MSLAPGKIDLAAPFPPVKRPRIRKVGDVAALRSAILDRVKESLQAWEGLSNDKFSLRLENVQYRGPMQYSIPEQQEAIYQGKTLGVPLYGEWVLRDADGQELHRRKSLLATVPYLTDLGTFVIRGNKYTMAHQMRLRPGAYVRVNRRGEVEGHINVLPGKGFAHYVVMDPKSGVFNLRIGQLKAPLYPLLRKLGYSDEQLRNAWGRELWSANAQAARKANLSRLLRTVLRNRYTGKEQQDIQTLRRRFEEMELDPFVTRETLGKEYPRVTPDLWLDITRKALKLQRREVDPDDRDDLRFQMILGPEDFLSQAPLQLKNKVRQYFWKAIARKRLDHFPARIVDQVLEDLIFRSGLGQAVEEINTAEIFDQQFRITRMGMGGIPSPDSVPDESRAVHPSQLGFLDFLRTPESEKAGVELRIAANTYKDDQGNLLIRVRDKQGNLRWITNRDAAKYKIALPVPKRLGEDEGVSWVVHKGKFIPVPAGSEDFQLENPEETFSIMANLVPFKSGVAGQRAVMASRMVIQANPLENGEAPLVQSADPITGESFYKMYATYFGALTSPVSGRVVEVTDSGIKVRTSGGEDVFIHTYNYFPFNRKSVVGTSVVAIKRADGGYWFGEVQDYQFHDGDQVLSLDDDRQPCWRRITAFSAHECDKRLFRVLTESGRRITVTEDHSLVQWPMLRPVLPEQLAQEGGDVPVTGLPDTYRGTFKASEFAAGVLEGLYMALGHRESEDEFPRLQFRCGSHKSAFLHAAERLKLEYRLENDGATILSWPEDCSFPVRKIYCDVVMPSLLDASPVRRFAAAVTYIQCEGTLTKDDEFPVQFKLSDHVGRAFLSMLFTSVGIRHYFLVDGSYFGFRAPTARSILRHPILEDRSKALLESLPDGNGERRWGNNAFGDRVVRIETAPHTPGPVYDFSVDGTERFVIDCGVVVHNTYLHSIPVVKPGQSIRKGQLIATSNYTDQEGALAVGKNLRVGFLPYGGVTQKVFDTLVSEWGDGTNWSDESGPNYEDAIVVSASAAKKLTSLHMYNEALKLTDKMKLSREQFKPLFPKKYDAQQLAKIGEDGVIRVGQTVEKGDPLILAMEEVESETGRILGRRRLTYRDKSVTWDHDHPGVVSKVVRRDGEVVVYVRSKAPLQVGDKLAGRHGNKGVVAAIVPDEHMPKDEQGRPLEIVLNPLGTPSRTNPAQIFEAILGKIAEKRGKPYLVKDFGFEADNLAQFVIDEAKKYGVKEKEKLYDPQLDKAYEATTGVMWFMKLHHMSESKESERSFGTYTSEESPAKGEGEAKRLGMMEISSLLSGGATKFIRESRVIRGAANPEFWSAFMSGAPLPALKVPMVYRKFVDTLKAAGINPVREGTRVQLMALTDKDIDRLAEGRYLQNAETVNWSKNLAPIRGGLFDPKLTGGLGGMYWSAIKLPEPLPNPVMEGPIKALLRLSTPEFEAVLAGKKELYGKKGGEAILEALSRIDLDREIKLAEIEQRSKRGAARDAAIRRLAFLRAAKRVGIHPKDWMWTKVPVLPPIFRPVSQMAATGTTLVADANYLYKELMDAAQVFQEKKRLLGEADEDRLLLYKSMRAVAGLGSPVHPKNAQRKVKGLLRYIFGNNPKVGAVQAKLLSGTVDLVGRGVITPSDGMDMDKIGIPEDMAWKIFEPFIVRRLVTEQNMRPVQALEAVQQRSKTARQALLAEMKERPVVVNRAPTLHRYGIMGFWPVLTKGHTIKVNNLVIAGFGGDYDGDSCSGSTICAIDMPASMGTMDGNLSSYPGESDMQTGGVMTAVATEPRVTKLVRMDQFPRIEESKVVKPSGVEVYQVPPGVRVLSYDPETGETGFFEVTEFSVHPGCTGYRVITRRKREVEVSQDHSLFVYDPEVGGMTRCRPEDAVGKLVPIVKRVARREMVDRLHFDREKYHKVPHWRIKYQIVEETELDFELGHWVGVVVGDAWTTWPKRGMVCYSETHEELIEQFGKVVDRLFPGCGKMVTRRARHVDQEMGLDATSVYTVYNSNGLARLVHEWFYVGDEHGAHNKQLPPWFVSAPEECLFGILSGLLDSDGSVSLDKRGRLVCGITTVSPVLVQQIGLLLRLLGIRYKVSVYERKNKPSRRTFYHVVLSNVDVYRCRDRIRLLHPKRREVLENLRPFTQDDRDIVPVPREICLWAMKEAPIKTSQYDRASAAKRQGYIRRDMAKSIAQLAEEAKAPPPPSFEEWRRIVENEDVHWDVVKQVERTTVQTMYDITVPDTKVFAVNDGLVIYDTMQVHVPVLPEAVEEVKEKLLPSKNLFSVAKFRAHYLPRHEYLGGLYLATTKKRKRKLEVFRTKRDAIEALQRGEIEPDTPVKILYPEA